MSFQFNILHFKYKKVIFREVVYSSLYNVLSNGIHFNDYSDTVYIHCFHVKEQIFI